MGPRQLTRVAKPTSAQPDGSSQWGAGGRLTFACDAAPPPIAVPWGILFLLTEAVPLLRGIVGVLTDSQTCF